MAAKNISAVAHTVCLLCTHIIHHTYVCTLYIIQYIYIVCQVGLQSVDASSMGIFIFIVPILRTYVRTYIAYRPTILYMAQCIGCTADEPTGLECTIHNISVAMVEYSHYTAVRTCGQVDTVYCTCQLLLISHTSRSRAYMSHVTVTLSMSHVTLTVLSRLCSAAWDNLSLCAWRIHMLEWILNIKFISCFVSVDIPEGVSLFSGHTT